LAKTRCASFASLANACTYPEFPLQRRRQWSERGNGTPARVYGPARSHRRNSGPRYAGHRGSNSGNAGVSQSVRRNRPNQELTAATASRAKASEAAQKASERYVRQLETEARSLRKSIELYERLSRAEARLRVERANDRGGIEAATLPRRSSRFVRKRGLATAAYATRLAGSGTKQRAGMRWRPTLSRPRRTVPPERRPRALPSSSASSASARTSHGEHRTPTTGSSYARSRLPLASATNAWSATPGNGSTREEKEASDRRRRRTREARDEAKRFRDQQDARDREEKSIRAQVAASELQARVYREVKAAGGNLAESQIRLRSEQLRLRGATDAQIRSFERAEREMLQYRGVVNSTRRAHDGMLASLSRFAARAVVAASAFQLVYGTARKVREGYDLIIEANSELEQARLGIAGTITVAGQFVDAYGKALPVVQQVNLALAEGDEILNRLLQTAAKRGLNFDALRETQVATAGITRAANSRRNSRVETIAGITTLADRLGVSQGRVVRTLDNILKGYRLSQTELGTILGISDKQVENWREQGTLAENLLSLISGVRETQGQNLRTYNGITEAIRAQGTILATRAGGGLFDSVKDSAEIIRQALEDLSDSPERLERVTQQFDRIGNSIEGIVGSLVNLVANLQPGDVEAVGRRAKGAAIGFAVGALGGSGTAAGGAILGATVAPAARLFGEVTNGRVSALDFIAANADERDAILRRLDARDARREARRLQREGSARLRPAHYQRQHRRSTARPDGRNHA
jgi:hypothetical protein